MDISEFLLLKRKRLLLFFLLICSQPTATESQLPKTQQLKLFFHGSRRPIDSVPQSATSFLSTETNDTSDVTLPCNTRLETTTHRRLRQQTLEDPSDTSSEYVCPLGDEEVDRYLNASSRTWLIQKSDVGRLQNDLQRVINCTIPGDYVLLNVTGPIQWRDRVTVPWKLTIGGYALQTEVGEGTFPKAAKETVMTCPRENRGVFLVKSNDVTFVNLEFTQCSLMARKSPTAIIEVRGCDIASINGTIQLHHVLFRRNQLRASVMVSMMAPSCSALEMKDVRFSNNECNGICGARMSTVNILQDITIQNNKHNIDSDTPVMLQAPDGSHTTAERIRGMSNTGTVLNVVNASLEISGSFFFRNARGESFEDVAPRSVPFDSVPFSASINLYEAAARIWDCRFVENSGVYGTAVVVVESNLTFHDSTVIGNTGSHGGATYFKSSAVNITKVTFSGNRASQGGGVGRVVVNSKMDIKNSTFYNNRAELEGGAFYVSQSIVLCRGTSFSENSAGEGGAFYFTAPSEFLIFQSSFSANKAEFGGALALYRSSMGIIQDSSFVRNSAENSGSFCYAKFNATLTVNYCQIAQNKATALFATRKSTLRIMYSNFTSNKAEGESGGGIFCSFMCSLQINHTIFTKNEALTGGAFALAETSSGDIENSQFVQNIAESEGGGGHLDENSTVKINRSVFRTNEAPQGGGLYLKEDSWANISHSQFFNGSSDGGAAINARRDCHLAIRHTLFEGNNAVESAGALEIYSTQCSMHRCVFQDNRAEMNGGAMTMIYSKLVLSDVDFRRNAAKESGGAIYSSFGREIFIDQTCFSENRARHGGSMALVFSTATITHSQFTKETAVGEDISAGGAIYTLGGDLVMNHVRMAENRAVHGADLTAVGLNATIANFSSTTGFAADGGGSILAIQSSTVELKNASFTNATANEAGGAIYVNGSALKATDIDITECQAQHGGAIYAASASVICSEGRFENNTAKRQGGGVYLSSQTPQFVAFQFENCRFVGNEAVRGGAMHVLGEDKIVNCSDPRANCTFVALSGTLFTKNRAQTAGGAILASDLNMIHLNCTAQRSSGVMEFFKRFGDFQYMDVLNRIDSICPAWSDNKAGVYGDVIGSYASRLRKWLQDGQTNSTVEITGNRYRVRDHQSGFLIPSVFLQMSDALGQGPVTGFGNAPIHAVMKSPDGLFTGELTLELEGGAANFSGVAGYVRPGDYDVQIRFSQQNLPQLILTIEIRKCTIGESIAANGTYCQPCSGDTYNFFPENGSCIACPENAKCDSVAIRPRPGYWHPMPCATHVQKCLTERACDSEGRDQRLSEVEMGMTDCNFTPAFIENYQNALCRKGYKGPLCGSCADGYGRSQSLHCERCKMKWSNYVLVLVSIIVMFGLTYFTVRSSISTGHKLRERRRRPHFRSRNFQREVGPSTSEIASRPSTTSEIASRTSDEHEITESPSTVVSESSGDDFDEEMSRRKVHRARENELMQWRAAEILKITINYLQVISIAVSLNVRWTDSVISAFEIAEFLGGLTTEATVRSFDCLITEDATLPRSVILTIVSLSVPVTVWLIYFFIWFFSMCLNVYSLSYLIQRSLLSLNVVSYVAYIGVTKTVVNILNCIKVHDSTIFLEDSTTYYWAVDTSQQCLTGTHAVLAGVAGFPILILFSLSFPLISAVILLTNRSRKRLQNQWLFATAGFMYRSYNQKFIFWESIIMLRKALLAIVVVFAYPLGGNLQGVLSSCVLIIALYVQAYCRPYRKEFKELNFYEGLSLLVSTLTFVAGLFFNDTRTSDTSRILLTVVVFLYNVAFLLFLIIIFWRSCANVLRSFLASKEPQVPDQSNLRRLLVEHAKTRITRVQTLLGKLSKNNTINEEKKEKEVELV